MLRALVGDGEINGLVAHAPDRRGHIPCSLLSLFATLSDLCTDLFRHVLTMAHEAMVQVIRRYRFSFGPLSDAAL